MLKHKLKVLVVMLIVLAFLVPTYVSFVSSSAGYIRINGTSASVPNQQVPAGGNVSLYVGDVMWSGSHLFLFLSHDALPQISSGDFVYTPRFSVYNLTNTTTPSIYSTDHGVWFVGNNWINGSIPQTVPVGNYSIKAFDEVTENVAVTDTFLRVYSVISASLQVSPSLGPGGVPVQFAGSGFPPLNSVTISYYDPTFASWNYFGTANANSSGMIAFGSEIPDLRKSVGAGDYSETYTPISFRAEIAGIVYAYADYNQYSRGLKRVGNQIAYGLYGNGTNFVSSVRVEADDSLALSGMWFHSSSVIYVRWDGVAVVGTVTSDEWQDASIIGTMIADSSGSFEVNVTIPTANPGEHYIAIEDSETIIIIKVLMSQGSLQVSPSSGPGGIPVQFTGSGYPASTSVTISYYDPTFGSWNYLGSPTADSAGVISFATEIPDLRKSVGAGDYSDTYTPISFRTEINGSVYCYADYNQYLRGLKRVGALTATGLYGNGTNLSSINQSISVSVKVGGIIGLTGLWFNPGVIYVRWDGVAVVGTVTGDEWRAASIIGTSIANASGFFATSATIPNADVGEHYLAIEDSETIVIIKIYVESSPTPTPTPTPTPSASPTPTPSPSPTPTPTPPTPQPGPTIAVSCRSTTRYTDFEVEIYGTLSFNGVAASGESVLISYSVTGGSSWDDLTLAKTGSDGGFLVVWKPSVTGYYLIKAKWEGNSTFNEASRIVNLALTPYLEQTVFSVASNSTISEFAFNSTSKELSFIASGPSGTAGYVSVFIPKSLISDISDLKIYVDGSLMIYSSESHTDSWLISFSYSHSAHKVVLDLSATSSETSETPADIIIYAIIIAVVIAIAVTAIVFKRKRGHTVHAGTAMPTEQ